MKGTLKDKKASLDEEYVANSVLEGNITVAKNKIASLDMTLNEANNAYFDNVETLKSFNEDKINSQTA